MSSSRKLTKNAKTSPNRTIDSSSQDHAPSQQPQPVITQSANRSQFLRNFLRRLGILLVAAAVTYLSLLVKDDPLKAFVKSTDSVSRRSSEVPCSDDYGMTWPECIPRRCGRVVMDSLLAPDDVDRILNIAKEGFRLARLPTARNVFTKKDFAAIARVRSAIQLRITLEFGGNPNKVFPTFPLVITRIIPEKVALDHIEYSRPHVDKEVHGTWYYSSLVDLGTYDEDFNGGRLVLVDKVSNRTVEPRKGRLSLFTSGSENRYYVERVRAGERYFLTVAFTCDPSVAMPDPSLQNLKMTK